MVGINWLKYKKQNKAGIGIFVSKNLDQYHFLHAIGSQSIFYAELYVIAIIKHLLNKLNLPTSNRIEIFCDNQSVFKTIYKQNNNEIYPHLANKCREMINHHNIIIHKVKSYIPTDTIMGMTTIKIPFNH